MTTYYLNGTALIEGADFTINGFTYPYSWLEGTSPSVRTSLGIEKTGDINYDAKYFWGVDNPKSLEDKEEVDQEGNPLFVKILQESNGTSVMVETTTRVVTKGLKTTCTEEIKTTTNSLLAPTDYYIIRGEVEGLQIPTSVSTYRADVVTESNRITDAIASVANVAELVELMGTINWPKQPK